MLRIQKLFRFFITWNLFVNSKVKVSKKAEKSYIYVYHFFLYLAINVEPWKNIRTSSFSFPATQSLERKQQEELQTFLISSLPLRRSQETENIHHNADPKLTVKKIAHKKISAS